MNQLLGLTALVGFLLSLVAHSYALAGTDLSARFPELWVLHVGALVLCIPPPPPWPLPAVGQGARSRASPAVREAFPKWVTVVGGILAAYALLNFVLFMFATEGGGPAESGGKFILQSHGRFIRELSSSESGPSERTKCEASLTTGFCSTLCPSRTSSSGSPVGSNPSIERTSYSRLRLLPLAAHVER